MENLFIQNFSYEIGKGSIKPALSSRQQGRKCSFDRRNAFQTRFPRSGGIEKIKDEKDNQAVAIHVKQCRQAVLSDCPAALCFGMAHEAPGNLKTIKKLSFRLFLQNLLYCEKQNMNFM